MRMSSLRLKQSRSTVKPTKLMAESLRVATAGSDPDRGNAFMRWGLRGMSVRVKLLSLVVATSITVSALTARALAVLVGSIEDAAQLEAT